MLYRDSMKIAVAVGVAPNVAVKTQRNVIFKEHVLHVQHRLVHLHRPSVVLG